MFQDKNEQGTYNAPLALINGAEHYLHRDHLGSILGISNASGSLVEERHFTPWGEVDVFKKNGIVQEKFEDSILPRGFTGHEHFEQINLIHMNGRLYDPQLRRFLSPDNHIQDPYDTRSYDRYAYTWHNPLMASDPSVEIIQFILFGAITGAFSAAANGGNFRDIVLGALVGGIAGGLGAGIGNLAAQGLGFAGSTAGFFGNAALSVSGFGAGFVVGFAGGFVGGFVGATLNGLAAGQNIGDALNGGIRAGVTAGVLAGLAAGIGAGVRAKKAGANFWDGSKETPLVSSVNEIKTKGVIIEDIKPQAGDLSGLRRIDNGLLDSPTGLGIRNDAGGSGYFGASRLRNNVSVPGAHKGIDFISVDGQDVISPISGRVVNRIGDSGPLIDIFPNNPNLGFDQMQILYVDSPSNVLNGFSRNINAGDVIGKSINLQSLGYGPKVGSHVHLQLWKNGVRINPYKFFFK